MIVFGNSVNSLSACNSLLGGGGEGRFQGHLWSWRLSRVMTQIAISELNILWYVLLPLEIGSMMHQILIRDIIIANILITGYWWAISGHLRSLIKMTHMSQGCFDMCRVTTQIVQSARNANTSIWHKITNIMINRTPLRGQFRSYKIIWTEGIWITSRLRTNSSSKFIFISYIIP